MILHNPPPLTIITSKMTCILNIESQDKLKNNCGECGDPLTIINRSGWFRFYGEVGNIQIEVCKKCNERQQTIEKSK